MSVAASTRQRMPARSRPILPNGVIAMVLFVFTEIMLFAGFISAHTIFRSQQVGVMWPPAGQPRLPVSETALNSAALLVSGIVLVLARVGFAHERRRALLPMGIAVALGTFFVGFQGVEWVALIREGLTLTSSNYGGFFYLLIGAHALHAVVALGCLLWAWLQLRAERLTASQFDTVSIFWYFVVLVWPVLYYQVYLQ